MKEYVAGVDIGGTTVKIGLFVKGGEKEQGWEVKTPTFEEGSRLWKTIADSIYGKLAELKLPKESLKAVGMGIPGPIRENGFLPLCVNLGLKACNPAELLSAEMGGIPVAAGNDANVAALGEAAYGAARDAANSLMITLGTGVGGGVIINNKILAGNRGIAGEIGHFVVNPDETVPCNCGNCGCLEQYASATGIVRTAKKLLAGCDTPSPLRELPDFIAKDVCDWAKQGDELSLKTLDIFGRYLGLGLAHAALIADPDVIVIGGGVSKAGQILLDIVGKYFAEYTNIAVEKAERRLALLGNDAGIYGAAAMAAALL